VKIEEIKVPYIEKRVEVVELPGRTTVIKEP
jgi:hypothetical protein